MLKKILIIFILIIIGSSAFIYNKIKTTPTSIYPYPFFVKKEAHPKSIEAQESDVLILGDRVGESLNRFIPTMNSELSKNLRTELKIVNLAKEGMALHRVVAQIRNLEKLPAITVVIGSAQEFLEERLRTFDKDTYEQNFKTFNDEKLSSLIISFPFLSKLIYKAPSKYFFLGKEIKPFKKASGSRVSQLRAEYLYKFYTMQLNELTNLVKEKSSTLIYITTPVNLEVKPRLVCDNSITNTIMIEQNDIEKLLKKGKSKEALGKLSVLKKSSFGNALTHFQLGRAYLLEGNTTKAKENLKLASALDCANWRANPIFNKLMIDHAKKNDINLVDFEGLVDSRLGKNILFKDDIFAQDLYYQELTKELALLIKNIYKI